MKKIPFYFSTDFEDFTHDLGRASRNPNPESREKALETSYLRAEDFSKNLDITIKSTENIIGEKPLGFRAPNFAIDQDNTWVYEELAKRFAYDSSYKTSSPVKEILVERKLHFNEHSLYEFCIFGLPILLGRVTQRTGGIFLRLFPSSYTIKAMKKTYEFGHVPLIDMHTYEMTLNRDFWVSWKDLKYLLQKDS